MSNNYKPEGMIFASQRVNEQSFTKSTIEKAIETGAILEGTVTMCDNDFNLHVDFCGIKGVIPKDECVYNNDGSEIKDIAIITRVGKTICFKVIGFTESKWGYIALLSRKRAQIECYNNYILGLVPGDVIKAKITHLESFGAFCDIGCGNIALLPIDSISISRIIHPRERLYAGMEIKALIKHIDSTNNRIFLSMRELLGTWEENAGEFSQGQTVTGIIRSIESYGVFVELTPNLAGLAELKEDISNLTSKSNENLIGKSTAVYIKSIIPDRMKIKLVLIDSYKADPMPRSLKYYIDDKITHIDYWRYSPRNAHKIVESIF